MVERDERERAETPEYEGVSDPGQRPLLDHLALQQHFPDEVLHPRRLGSKLEIGVFGDRRIVLTTGANRRQNRKRNRGMRSGRD